MIYGTPPQPLAEIMTLARTRVDEPVPPAPEPEPWADGTDDAGALLRLVDNGDAATLAPVAAAGRSPCGPPSRPATRPRSQG